MHRLRKQIEQFVVVGKEIWRRVLPASLVWLLACACSVGAQAQTATASPQEPTGEIIGTIEGQAISVKGPMSVQVVGNEVKTLLRSGVDVRVKLGRARINLAEGGTIALCGPAHISMLKVGKALTVALDSGTVHAHVEGNLTLNIFTAQILAKTVAIGNGPQDVLVGFDAGGLMCVRASRGALRLEEQFSGQNLMVPQGGDVTIANGQLQGLRNSSGLCACDSFEQGTATANAAAPEISTLASGEEVKRNAAPRKRTPQVAADTTAPEIAKPPAPEPTYQVFMPPLRYDANAKVQEEPDMKMVMLVRRVRVKPTLIFQSRVEGDLPQQGRPAAAPAKPAKAETADKKKENPENTSVMNRVKTFIKSLWSPSS